MQCNDGKSTGVIPAGENNTTVDAGYYKLGGMGDLNGMTETETGYRIG